MGGIGYDDEIHYEDSFEFTYKLPLGAIKRLIKSYFKDIDLVISDWVYYRQTGSWGIRIEPYCNRMISNLIKQLDKHGLNGKKIINEVFNRYFKVDYEKMNRYSKNHHDQDLMLGTFQPCNDLKCCNYPIWKKMYLRWFGKSRSILYRLQTNIRKIK